MAHSSHCSFILRYTGDVEGGDLFHRLLNHHLFSCPSGPLL